MPLNTRDLKYLAAYSTPAVFVLSTIMGGYWGYATIVYVFVLVPILELLLPQSQENLGEEDRVSKSKSRFFDFLLYANLPLVFGLLLYFYQSILPQYDFTMILGYALSLGIVVGANGINVAHELGHRTTKAERFMGKLLLCPALYMHFYIEHNYGHHQHAATPEDPATARYNQAVYLFWISSIFGQLRSALKIQKTLIRDKGGLQALWHNDLFWYALTQGLYLFGIAMVFGSAALTWGLLVALVAVLLLETTNYIEHYGLMRPKKPSGRYAPVKEIHSWNSNHLMGRILLYELTRHSDHHYRSQKKYQLLDHHATSPELPFGYPTSIVLSLFPPLWFFIMNPRVPSDMKP